VSQEKKTNTLILVCCHNKQNILETKNIKPILVGAEISKLDIYPYKDNIGDDNISIRNPNYNELTAMYWAWKNLSADITNIGFFHYRRYLSLRNTIAPAKFLTNARILMEYVFGYSQNLIEKLSQEFDIILPLKQKPTLINKGVAKNLNMGEHFVRAHSQKVVDEVRNIILEKMPEYKTALEVSLNEKSCYFKNIFIMKKEYFNNYMTFMFNVLFEFEARNKNNEIASQARINGFIAERLINIYVNKLIAENKNIKLTEFKILRRFHINILNSAYCNKQFSKLKNRLNLNYIKYAISIITGKGK
jgi:hypothetical protein